MLSINSKLKEIYQHPIGKDVISKLLLQLNKPEMLITNPVIGNMKLKALATLTKKFVDPEFFNVLLTLLNSEMDVPKNSDGPIKEQWWKEAVFYQIYPRSFKDSNNDGVGDIGGIIEKLDYLQDLGIDAIWLSPIYDSPNDDNGYDIRDYYKIMEEFGTMEQFDDLLAQIHARGMRLIMDLVVNHTSDEHEWFQEALKNPESKYRDYYFFEDKPNNWTSFFSGSAWNYYEEIDKHALHLFSKKQMDLNWDNEQVRKDVADMVAWWLAKGVDGFRLDVINYISKAKGLPEGNEMIYELMGYRGIENYFYGPNLHQYLNELNQRAFKPYNAFSVGETPGVGMEMSKLLTADYRNELDMIFSFDQLETPGHVRFDEYQYDLNYLKTYLIKWMNEYPNACWMSLFYENHDNPRMVSKVNPDPKVREVLAKLLAVLQLTLKGTPFIFQGQEIGMINQEFTSIEEMRDVESINLYEELIEQGLTKEEAFKKVMAGSRDHARTPVQWDDSLNAGFSSVTPWIVSDEDYKIVNVESQLKEAQSVLNFYKKLINYRKQFKALIYGEVEFVDAKRKNYFAYYRKRGGDVFFVECNLSNKPLKKKYIDKNATVLVSNYLGSSDELRPYEASVLLVK
ncbi:MAG: alpha-glucosidase [Streptococcaceae bacterium]|jgi:oligo-1,6-glucosidase|nr:alpha-glucosidase [Streptococcaceae bacterium]